MIAPNLVLTKKMELILKKHMEAKLNMDLVIVSVGFILQILLV